MTDIDLTTADEAQKAFNRIYGALLNHDDGDNFDQDYELVMSALNKAKAMNAVIVMFSGEKPKEEVLGNYNGVQLIATKHPVKD